MRAVKRRQVWGQGCACAFSNVMCLKRRVPSVGKAENFPKINPEREPPLHLPSWLSPRSLILALMGNGVGEQYTDLPRPGPVQTSDVEEWR